MSPYTNPFPFHLFRLIVVAALVELGEIIARLIVHATLEKEKTAVSAAMAVCSSALGASEPGASRFAELVGSGKGGVRPPPLGREEALRTLEAIMEKYR